MLTDVYTCLHEPVNTEIARSSAEIRLSLGRCLHVYRNRHTRSSREIGKHVNTRQKSGEIARSSAVFGCLHVAVNIGQQASTR